jgi:hypothetical protein
MLLRLVVVVEAHLKQIYSLVDLVDIQQVAFHGVSVDRQTGLNQDQDHKLRVVYWVEEEVSKVEQQAHLLLEGLEGMVHEVVVEEADIGVVVELEVVVVALVEAVI